MKITLKDQKLLYWLDQNSRLTNKELGRKIGLTEQAIGYKIKRLQEENILKNCITFINVLSLGYYHYKVFLRLHNTTEEIEEKFINSLSKHHNIRYVAATSGKYDLSFSLLAKSPLEFSTLYQQIISHFSAYIAERNIVTNIASIGFTRNYLIEEKQSKKLNYTFSKEIQEIDEIDYKILKVISLNARKNIIDIAKETKTTIDIVRYRLKKLQERNIIAGFTININLEKMGYEYYSIFLHLKNLNQELEQKMITFAQYHSNILFVVKVIGNYDYQLEIEVKNYHELELLIKEFRQTFSNQLNDFEILKVTKEYKYDFFPFN